MVDQQHAHILRRMAGQRQEDVAESPLTSSRAVRIALTKVAQDSVGLSVTVQSVEEIVQPLDDLLGELSDDLMLVGLERSGNLVGLTAIDMQLRAAVVEMQTVKTVGAKPADNRAATHTDKRLCDPLLSGLLGALPQAVIGTEFEGWMDGALPGGMLQSVRAAGLVLDDQSYRVLRMRVGLGAGEREGMIALVLPILSQQALAVEQPPQTTDWPGTFRAVVSEAPVSFDAELCRFQMPIGRADNLAVGDVLPLAGCTVASVELRALDGQTIRHARLGQSNGYRAVRIAAQALPDMGEFATMSADMADVETGAALPADDMMALAVDTSEVPDNNLSFDPGELALSETDEVALGDTDDPAFPMAQAALADLET